MSCKMLNTYRGHVCRKWNDFCESEAFHAVAPKRPDLISLPALEDVTDPQNAFTAADFFSLQVMEDMRELGFDHSADFVYLAHRFYVATNERGICADERVHMLHSMHKFLVKDLSFEDYPPKGLLGRYIKGMPYQTFEAILHICSNRIQLYPLAFGKCYNQHEISTLGCESYFSDVVRSDREGVHLPHLTFSSFPLSLHFPELWFCASH